MKKNFIIPLIATVLLIIFFVLFFFRNSIWDKTVEITFRITWDKNSSRGIAISKIVDSYNESQKKVHVMMVGGNEEKADYIAALSEDAVDVYMVPYRYIKNSKISGEFMLLTKLYMEQEEYYCDTIKELAKSEEGIAAIPWIGHSMGLIYNKDIVAAADVDPESFTSVWELLDACEAVNHATGAGGLGLVGADSHDLTWMISQFIYSFGGKLAETDARGIQTNVLINSKESAEAVDFYINKLGPYAQEGWQEHTGTEVMDAFRAGEIAFEIQGPWGITDIWKSGESFEVGAVALSGLDMYSEVGPLMLAISKDTENPESAEDFIRYLIDKDTLEKVMEGEYDDKYEAYYPYRVPLRKDMEDSEFFTKYPEFLVFIEGYKKPSINTPTYEWEEEYKSLYSFYMHQVIIGNISIDQSLEDIAGKKPN